jgi:hypothetical protein
VEGETEGVRSADLGLDTNLRVNLIRSLVSLLNPLNLPKVLGLPITAVLNLFLNDSAPFEAVKVSELGIDILSRLALEEIRWDPFFSTKHGFLLESQEVLIEDNRLFLRGKVHLSKTFVPYERVWVREAAMLGTGVSRLLYKVEELDEMITDSFFATEREAYET